MPRPPPLHRRPAIRVVLADHHPVLRDVARMACESHPDVDVIAEVDSGELAVDACLRLAPDILVLDLDLPDIDGFEVSRRLRQAGSPVKILATTGSEGVRRVFDTLRHGIAGCVEKLAVVELPSVIQRLTQ